MLHCCLLRVAGAEWEKPCSRPRDHCGLLPGLSTLKLPFFYTLVDSGNHLWQQPRLPAVTLFLLVVLVASAICSLLIVVVAVPAAAAPFTAAVVVPVYVAFSG